MQRRRLADIGSSSVGYPASVFGIVSCEVGSVKSWIAAQDAQTAEVASRSMLSVISSTHTFFYWAS